VPLGTKPCQNSVADLSDIKNIKVIAIHPIDPKNTEWESLLSMRMTSGGTLLALFKKGKYLLFFTSSSELDVFEMIK
jgi:hypothetical protein